MTRFFNDFSKWAKKFKVAVSLSITLVIFINYESVSRKIMRHNLWRFFWAHFSSSNLWEFEWKKYEKSVSFNIGYFATG